MKNIASTEVMIPHTHIIHKDVTLDKKLEIFKEAKELRQAGRTVTIQMMRKNMKQQINMLEAEGYTEFKKVYND